MRDYTKIAVKQPDLTFFTADLHFFHEGIIGHCRRPFRDAAEMNETLIRNWNLAVPGVGNVFVLGDMFYKKGSLSECRKIMEKLNGRKWLIAGNHDLFTREEYLDLGFEDARDYLEPIFGWRRVVLSHYPLLEWNGFYRGAWHLHGHVHGRRSHFSFRVMDAGVDANNYMPVGWREVERRLEPGMALDEAAMKERGDTARHRPYSFKLTNDKNG